ncbi:hypothetical protein K0M31_008311 [Melipona bicolor]|uniref:Uncharacterized protein n=1 Tax=Melipona bicolor TaxID=60889 RepID=A0AA40KKB7_9HYME|nr:hypothetical protein K0M31_008311 [Melipona bicolor]
MFVEVTEKKISIVSFRRQLADELIHQSDEEIPMPIEKKKVHQLQKKDVHKIRKYCSGCCNNNSTIYGRKIARNLTKKVITFCNTCENKPYFCLECFNKFH